MSAFKPIRGNHVKLVLIRLLQQAVATRKYSYQLYPSLIDLPKYNIRKRQKTKRLLPLCGETTQGVCFGPIEVRKVCLNEGVLEPYRAFFCFKSLCSKAAE